MLPDYILDSNIARWFIEGNWDPLFLKKTPSFLSYSFYMIQGNLPSSVTSNIMVQGQCMGILPKFLPSHTGNIVM